MFKTTNQSYCYIDRHKCAQNFAQILENDKLAKTKKILAVKENKAFQQ